ncbi:hypothetical protein WICMUC_005474 [Wickerhamomyces mucosus]|uniref:Sorbose reductase SOU1 n=1 Tax=Wickerhamomyces mucosus TaxID=1378264 RepID=A0A9P8P811_9ASCO|nr:hypothetical protein WICMUC_005474 [Wickerhamomyces mucosus]
MTLGNTETPASVPSYILEDYKGDLPHPSPKLSKNIFENFSLKGKVAVITGGSRGIGYAVADAYAQAGADVVIIGHTPKVIEDATNQLKSNYKDSKIASYAVEVSDPKAVDDVVKQIEKEFGTIDILVGNAGIIWTDGGILTVEKEEGVAKWQKLLDVNLSANYYFAQSVGEIFKKHRKGSFIVTASMSGHIANVPNYQTPYNTTKAALRHFASSLAVEWAPIGARVNSISPGYIDSGISDVLDQRILKKWLTLIPFGRQGLPEELVGAYLYLASDASTYTTGSDIRIDGGYTSV